MWVHSLHAAICSLILITGRSLHPRPPLLIRVTGCRLFTITMIIAFRTAKAVASYQGKTIISTSLDWVMGVLLAIGYVMDVSPDLYPLSDESSDCFCWACMKVLIHPYYRGSSIVIILFRSYGDSGGVLYIVSFRSPRLLFCCWTLVQNSNYCTISTGCSGGVTRYAELVSWLQFSADCDLWRWTLLVPNARALKISDTNLRKIQYPESQRVLGSNTRCVWQCQNSHQQRNV